MLTAEQKELRQKYIGSSDAAAILGLDPNRTPADVWLEKTNRADGFAGNKHTERGELFESGLVTFIERRTGLKFDRGVMRVHANAILAANFDGLNSTVSVEAKTTGIADGWGEEGSDEVPQRVLAQVHHQFACAPTVQLCYVPVLVPGFQSLDLRAYEVAPNSDLVEIVQDRLVDFHDKFIKRDIRPDDYRPSLEVLKRMRRQANKIIDLPTDLRDRLVAARAAKKLAAEEEEAAQAALLIHLGDAECGECADGTKVTNFETSRRGYQVGPCSFRQLRVCPAKG